ncbi:helix-turn-helix domain-containing protein [Paenibacillus sp. N1-5-1-14]|uniref:helix-turn-helix domain-containing protein n=1 Tax=Paenibacillus radicibacter TaxID=2972488 RepID=UPI0021590A78|nr:helix-turn-helix domain-containing protein [Paenibacillus radicibacter]MCR8643989.1 helix-turn-helix domain-containing protein [Paenibacillus radicibacter]
MRKEQTSMCNLSLIRVKNMKPAVIDGLRVVLVLKGKVQVFVDRMEYSFVDDDMIILNPYETLRIESTGPNLILMLTISRKHMESCMDEPWHARYACNSATIDSSDERLTELRTTLTYFMLAYYRHLDSNPFEIRKHLFEVLSVLTKYFIKEVSIDSTDTKFIQNERIHHILQYVDQHYRTPLSLEQIASESYISLFHLSRLFKKTMGKTFTQHVNEVRLEKAVLELTSSSESILKLALHHGFANIKIFNKSFRACYGMTPSEYRTKQNSSVNHATQSRSTTDTDSYEVIHAELALQELSRYMVEKEMDDDQINIQETRQFTVPRVHSEHKDHLKLKKPARLIQVGSYHNLLAHEVREQLRIVAKELQMAYVCFEGFHPGLDVGRHGMMMSANLYNNEIFDFLQEIKLKPFIQLNSNIQVEAIITILTYWINRYGINDVLQWRFELVKYPAMKDSIFLEWYRALYQAMMKLHPELRIGVYAMSYYQACHLKGFKKFLYEVDQSQQLPSFITINADPMGGTLCEEETIEPLMRAKYIPIEMLQQLQSLYLEMNVELPDMILRDWNTLAGQGEMSGSFFRAALIIDALTTYSNHFQGIGYWLDIKVKDSVTEHKGFSCLSLFMYGELKRPLYFVLQLMDRLASDILLTEEGVLITREEDKLYVLVYNTCYSDPIHSIDQFLTRSQNKQLHLVIEGLESRTYLMKEYLLDKDHGGIYNEWLKVGSPVDIDAECADYLTRKIVPAMYMKRQYVQDTLKLTSNLTINSCKLYIVEPEYS